MLQIFITYTPGLNENIFSMAPMDGTQWGIVALGMIIVLVVMETEKAIRNFLTELKYDTDDLEYGLFDSDTEPDNTPLPIEVNRFGLSESDK